MESLKQLALKIVFHYKYLGRDKLEHFYSASLGMLIFSVVFTPIIASFIVIGFALGKEIINDLILKKGNPEILDAVMSSLPVLIYWVLYLC